MDANEIKDYWERRAAADDSPRSTTDDYYLREIELRVLRDVIGRHSPATVLDVGCGDAVTTTRLALELPELTFVGIDYSEAMIANARRNVAESAIGNVEVMVSDVSSPLPVDNVDMVYTTRCLINLPTWQAQQAAIDNIADALSVKGHYVMVENFIDGHDSFNGVRRDLGLPEIAVRDHNLFFDRQTLSRFLDGRFEIVDDVNISSTYYLATRVIYSRICQENGVEPDYLDPHHRYAAQLPFCGEFGPVRMLCLRRK